MSNITCKICNAKVKKKDAFNFAPRKYCCSEDEFEKTKTDKSLYKNINGLITSLFESKVYHGYVIQLNEMIKDIRSKHGEEFLYKVGQEVYKTCADSALFNRLEYQKARYTFIIKVFDGAVSTRVNAEKNRKFVPVQNEIEVESNRMENNTNISSLIDRLGV